MKTPSNEELITFLRQLADFYEQHPTIPAPIDMTWGFMTIYLPKDIAVAALKEIGSFTKHYDGDYFDARKQLGYMDLRFRAQREAVCERVLVGKKLVPETVIPAISQPERVIPEHEEDIVEWHCSEPILQESERIA